MVRMKDKLLRDANGHSKRIAHQWFAHERLILRLDVWFRSQLYVDVSFGVANYAQRLNFSLPEIYLTQFHCGNFTSHQHTG